MNDEKSKAIELLERELAAREAQIGELRTLFARLLEIRVDGIPRGFKSSGFYTKGDEDQPFFSESFLYNLLGKDAARSVLYPFEKLGRLIITKDPNVFRRHHEAQERLLNAVYGLDQVGSFLRTLDAPEQPERVSLPPKDKRTKEDLNRFNKYTEELRKYREHAVVAAQQALHSILEARTEFIDAWRAVGDATTEPTMLHLLREDQRDETDEQDR